MKAFFSGLTLLLIVAGCESTIGVEDDAPQDLLSLIDQLDESGTSLLTSPRSFFVREFAPAYDPYDPEFEVQNSGQLPNGIHYGFLSPEVTSTIHMAEAWGLLANKNASSYDVEAAVDCKMGPNPNSWAKVRFGKCVANLHAHCDGAWSWSDADGSYASGHNMVTNDEGDMVLVDCDLPDDEEE